MAWTRVGERENDEESSTGRGKIKRAVSLLFLVALAVGYATAQEDESTIPIPGSSADLESATGGSAQGTGESGSGDPTAGGGGQSAGGLQPGITDLLRMVLVLAAVVGVIYLIFYLLKRSTRGKLVESDVFRLVGAKQLPGGRLLYLVEVGNQVFLLGSGDKDVHLVSEITDQESVDMIRLRAEATPAERKSFAELLGGMFKSNGDGSPLGFLQRQRGRLKNLQ